MERLSLPLAELRRHYHVVVVGTGYGGGVAAARLAETFAPGEVCVLERGRERHPGDYPDRLWRVRHEVRIKTPNGGRFGPEGALLHVHAGPDMNVIVGSGLGGTSQINAGVAIEPTAEVFRTGWPEALSHIDEIAGYFELARTMLGSTEYPNEDLAKYQALKASAEALGAPVRRAKVNVTFTDRMNDQGVLQPACTGCGDCVSGCNVGAKNTTLMNYLPLAVSHGASIFCELAVRRVEPAPGGNGWALWVQSRGAGRSRFPAPDLLLTADIVVLAAGTLGSTEILLRSRAAGLPLSPMIGRRFSGNGDLLGFAYAADRRIGGIGGGGWPPSGPTIVGTIDRRRDVYNTYPDGVPSRTAMIIQEGVIPGPLSSLMPLGFALGAGLSGLPSDERRKYRRRLPIEVLKGAYRGATSRTQTFLVMSTDDARGSIELQGDTATVVWPGVARTPIVDRDSKTLQDAAGAIGGGYIPSPSISNPFGRALVTVQPLGGCAMADDAADGVVNHAGQVYCDDHGGAVHEGLYVADGSIIPEALSANPLLTITALAERICHFMGGGDGAVVTAAMTWTQPRLRFSDRMIGYVSTRVLGPPGADDFTDARVLGVFESATAAGKAEGSTCEFVVTIEYDDVDKVLNDSGYPAVITGTLSVPALQQTPFTVLGGRFRMLFEEPRSADTWHMTYRMDLETPTGSRWTFEGTKVVRCDARPWADTTTLYSTIRDDQGAVVARGILRIGVGDTLRLVRTFEIDGAATDRVRVRLVARFNAKFAGKLLPIYGGPLGARQQFARSYGGTPARRPSSLSPSRWWWTGDGGWLEAAPLTSEDAAPGRRDIDRRCRASGGLPFAPPPPDASLAVTRFQGGSRGPVLLSPGFAMPASSYTLTTTDENLVEHLYRQGFDVWLVDLRFSPLLPSSRAPGNIDKLAMEDWPRVIDKVLDVTGAPSVQIMAHCFTSAAIQMGLLASATLEGKVRSLVACQTTVHPIMPFFNRTRARLKLADRFTDIGFTHINLDKTPDVGDYALDAAFRLNPMLHGEGCTSPVCRWAFWWFGPIIRHAQLNEATHLSMCELFESTNMSYMQHISLMVTKKVACDATGKNVYVTPANAPRLRIPILFLAGRENRMFLPETSAKTLSWLVDNLDPQAAKLFERIELPNYAHLDTLIGRTAHHDVYPLISRHFLPTADLAG